MVFQYFLRTSAFSEFDTKSSFHVLLTLMKLPIPNSLIFSEAKAEMEDSLMSLTAAHFIELSNEIEVKKEEYQVEWQDFYRFRTF